jgi:hypothetical protein
MPEVTQYEAGIIREIASWKAEKHDPYHRLTAGLTRPLARGLQHVIPQSTARAAIETAYNTSKWLASSADILEKGGVGSVDELRHKSLELSDQLADVVGHESQTMAAVDGAVTGAGGVLLSVADVGMLAVLALRAVHRTGQCYGYSLDRPEDRAYALGILMLAGLKSHAERLEVMGKLRNVEQWALGEAVEAVAIERIAQKLIEVASLESIPGLGLVLGSASNLYFIRQVLRAARHVFQERWLRENGKLTPAEC